MKRMIVRHQDMEAYKKAFEAAMQVFERSKEFPMESRHSMQNRER